MWKVSVAVVRVSMSNQKTEQSENIIILRRDVDALLVPSGARIFLQAGTEVKITQSLGGSFTVNIYGNLARIDANDADALGMQQEVEIPESVLEEMTLEELIWKQMKKCYDPEIPINIVDLGLIYQCEIIPLGTNEFHVQIKMTLTAPGCGMGPTIASDVKRKVLAAPRVKTVDVEMVFDPPWSREMMSDVAKLELGML